MPKLLLSVSGLRSLAGRAVDAARHPVATGQDAVAVARTVAGGLVAKAREQQARITPTQAKEPPGPVPATPEASGAAAPEAPAAETARPDLPQPPVEPAPEPSMAAQPRRTGPAPHLSHMPRDIERDVEAELEDSEAAGGASATYEPEIPGREPEQPGTEDVTDPGVAKSVRKESARAARASDAKKS